MKISLKVLALWACVLAGTVNAQVVSTPNQASDAPSGTSANLPSASQPSSSAPASSSAPTSASATASSSGSVSATATSSSATATGTSLSDCLTADPFSNTDFFANSKLTDPLQNTTGFSVSYEKTYKVVTNMLTNENYILYCTQAQPNLTGIQAKTFIHIPVTKLAVVDTRALGYLGLLNQNDIVYIGNTSNLTTPCVTSKPSLYNVSSPSFSQSAYDLVIFPTSGGNDPNGISFGLNYQATPLALAEWIKYFSLFTNQETVAQQIYNEIKQSYQTASSSINSADISYKRNITFVQYFPDSTKFNVFEDMYFKNITSAAGANLTTALIAQPGDTSTLRAQVTNSSLVIDFTALVAPNNTFDYWNNWIGYIQPNLTNAANTALDNAQQHGGLYINDPEAPPFERFNQLWRVDKSVDAEGADDFYTRGLARPDLVVQELIMAQYPDYPGGYQRVFLRNFATEPTTTTNANSYGCGLATNIALASTQSYSNHTADSPMITFSSSLSLGAIIGLSIGGGLIAIACIAASAVTISKKIKNRRRFTRLTDVGGEAFDMPRQSHAEETALYGNNGDFDQDDVPTGRFGGSGRQMS
ncbi:hypothetical protein BGW37DRAFT_490172 [Umbelopsis sp. PMI_123]|nr:hypothetical protein BGW37DRAFT_490172 [Umbelopsis sp. PMI_123]